MPPRPRAVPLLAAFVATLTALALLSAAPAQAAPAVPAAPADPTVVGGASQATYSYADAIREHVVVTSAVDSDGDGKGDAIAVDIVRPREAAAAGRKVPVVMEASPYYVCCGRGNESQIKEYAADGTVDAMPLYYDNYFVPRGYAFVAVDLTGTNESSGCPDVGGPAEIAGAKAVVDWLNGRATAVGADGAPVRATWTNGRTGMIGKSWDATIANGVAATGVAGLETIVPIAGISSWYAYERRNGVPVSPGYPTFLAQYVAGSATSCAAEIAADQAAADDATGNYNAYWAARNYRPDASKVTASVFVVHGLNDLNVTTDQFGAWWSGLATKGVPRKIWLSQQGHVDPFDYRRATWVPTLRDWFDHWLKGLDNHVMDQPQASIEKADGTWTTAASWPAPGARQQVLGLGAAAAGGAGRLGTGSGTVSVTDAPDADEATQTAKPNSTSRPGRAVFLSAPLTSAVRVSGTAVVTVRVKLDRPNSEVTAKLVDYGRQTRVDYLSRESGIVTGTTRSCWGKSTATDSACYLDATEAFTTSDVDVLTRGWTDVAHAGSLSRYTPAKPGSWVTLTIPLAAQDAVIAAGHTIGLVLTLSDTEYTSPTTTGATATFDLSRSTVTLPAVGTVPAAGVTPTVDGTAVVPDRRAPVAGGLQTP